MNFTTALRSVLLFSLTIVFSTAFSQLNDTLVVNQADTTVFHSDFYIFQLPCSRKVEFSCTYELKAPVDSAYYLIYNSQNQLVQEGRYSYLYNHDSLLVGGLFTSSFYNYDKKGRLETIFYQKDGRNQMAKYYKRGKLKEVKEFN